MTTKEIINLHLNSEKILWQGKPEKVPTFIKSDILLIPLTLIFAGFLVVYSMILASLLVKGESAMFSLIGITMFLIGIYLLVLRFWYRKKRISRQLYFITDKRLFAFDTMRDDVIFNIPIHEACFYSQKRSIVFHNTNPLGDFIYDLGLDIFFRKFIKETPKFKYINDLNKVYGIITELNAKEN